MWTPAWTPAWTPNPFLSVCTLEGTFLNKWGRGPQCGPPGILGPFFAVDIVRTRQKKDLLKPVGPWTINSLGDSS